MPFNGIPNLRDANEPVKLDLDKLREIKKCAIDPIYFIRNYVYINTKDNGMQLFDLYDFQEAALKRFLNTGSISTSGPVRWVNQPLCVASFFGGASSIKTS